MWFFTGAGSWFKAGFSRMGEVYRLPSLEGLSISCLLFGNSTILYIVDYASAPSYSFHFAIKPNKYKNVRI
jgi:hypothetical protein